MRIKGSLISPQNDPSLKHKDRIPFLRKDFQILKLKVFPFNDGEKWWIAMVASVKSHQTKRNKRKQFIWFKTSTCFSTVQETYPFRLIHLLATRSNNTTNKPCTSDSIFGGPRERGTKYTSNNLIHQRWWFGTSKSFGFGHLWAKFLRASLKHHCSQRDKTLTFHEILIGSWPDLYFIAYEIFHLGSTIFSI